MLDIGTAMWTSQGVPANGNRWETKYTNLDPVSLTHRVSMTITLLPISFISGCSHNATG